MKREGERGRGKEGEGIWTERERKREKFPNVYTYPKLLILVKDTVLEICSISCCVCQSLGT